MQSSTVRILNRSNLSRGFRTISASSVIYEDTGCDLNYLVLAAPFRNLQQDIG